MKVARIISVILIICVVITGCSRADDFRGANWGDSQAKVIKSEDIEYAYADDDLVMYVTEMDGKAVEIYYSFVDNKLTEAEVKFIKGDRRFGEIVKSYDGVAEQLTEIYGEPKDPDKFVWLVGEEKRKDEKTWRSIYHGRLAFILEWETKTTYVKLELSRPRSTKKMTYTIFAQDIKLRQDE